MTKTLLTLTSILRYFIHQSATGKQKPVPNLIGIIIAVLLIESMGKPTDLEWTGGLQ